jgi:hypothetical protein
MKRKTLVSVVTVLLVAAGMANGNPASASAVRFTPSVPASVPPPDGCGSSYHYAGMYTSTVQGSWQNDQFSCGGDPFYNGWAGIDGLIGTPATNPTLDIAAGDHQSGWIGMVFGTGGWIQIGWYRGNVGCNNTAGKHVSFTGTGYHLYLESSTTGDPVGAACVGYQIQDLSPLSLGGSVTYRIDREGSCWVAYYNYNHQAGSFCGTSWPSSGHAEMENELYATVGTSSKMPTSDFGSSNPDSNPALRLLSGTGWVPWTANIIQHTSTHDWRYDTSNSKTVFSPYASFYHIHTYGAA